VLAKDDLVMFINACLACSGQREFYDDRSGQKISIDFLHDYIMGNYRLLYARTLAAGINHFNQTQIVLKLLATGKNTLPEHRTEEGALIAKALEQLPPQRAWGVLQELRQRHINNRRSRAIARDYLNKRQNLEFEGVKYRAKIKAIATHAHLDLPGELGSFLFKDWQKKVYTTPIFETFRAARYSEQAIYKLPFTIAEGLAVKKQVDRERFLNKIEERMTVGEKLRLQGVAERAKKVDFELDFGRLPLTKLILYILSLPKQTRLERQDIFAEAIDKSVRRTIAKNRFSCPKVAAVLDRSYSSSGSSEKRRRPLGVALASHYLLERASSEYRAFWTTPIEEPLTLEAKGQTDLATPLLAALEWNPDLIVIISDGCENSPPQGAAEILRIYRSKLDPESRLGIVHLNPVYNAEDYTLRSLSSYIPTVGLRDAEDLPTMLNFSRFASGNASIEELEAYLAQKVREFLQDEKK
jgi:hypothetical protein